ncbi:MAG TPA: methylated-DNA--[protein]-cysteine S-methyltransferase [Thermoanaerobaculia bacterium]|nr:methylated-DNA--[protein]-cysteine S-methyltransferase [Thermoanaerobaculia bacterium]
MTCYVHTIGSPCGPLLLAVDDHGAVIGIEFVGPEGCEPPFLDRLVRRGVAVVESEDATAELARQLAEYFDGERQEFELELAPEGSDFQLRVWGELRRIPYGETRSYGEIAAAIGRPDASRAVGAANGANPIPIVVPCHRVIGANGSLTGFGGGLAAKRTLLALEGNPVGRDLFDE